MPCSRAVKQNKAMSISLKLLDDKTSITIDALPDVCPQCGMAGKQILTLPPIMAYDGSTKAAWITLTCPVDKCGRPFFAVYKRAMMSSPISGFDFQYCYTTPFKPRKLIPDPNISALSEHFYEIMDEANAARRYGLHLIAGMGYRKALEFLAKDYVVSDLRSQHKTALERGDQIVAERIKTDIDRILERPLAQVVAMIPHDLTKEAAKRAVWLGNDETHYSRIWTQKDVRDLISLILGGHPKPARGRWPLENRPLAKAVDSAFRGASAP
jgi:hypothetical protein